MPTTPARRDRLPYRLLATTLPPRRGVEECGVVGQRGDGHAGGEAGVHFVLVFDAFLPVLPAEAYFPAGGE